MELEALPIKKERKKEMKIKMSFFERVFAVINIVFTLLMNGKVATIALWAVMGMVVVTFSIFLLGAKVVLWTVVGVIVVAVFFISIITGLFWGQ